MPDHPSDAERFQLFGQTVAGMERRLRRVRSARQMMTALRWGLDELDATYARTPARVLAQVACRAGCDFCCRVPVDVQAHEVFFSADHIQVHFPPAALDTLIARLAVHRASIAALPAGARQTSRLPCVLLQDGSCSIYEGRPEACRAHHATDPKLCAANMADPSVDDTPGYIPALRARMFAVMLGMDEALEAEGYDDRAYDFGSALHEALTNSLCLAAWLRREPAFPDSCLADPVD